MNFWFEFSQYDFMEGCSCMSDYSQIENVMGRMTQAFDYSGNLSVKENQNGW